MGKITDSIKSRIEAGEDRNRLSAELCEIKMNIQKFSGYQCVDPEKNKGIMGHWDMARLLEATRQAEQAKQPTPLDQLKDAEVAGVYVKFVDMDNPTARRALENALAGKTATGASSNSTAMKRHLAEYARKQHPNAKADGSYNGGTFKLGEL